MAAANKKTHWLADNFISALQATFVSKNLGHRMAFLYLFT